MSSAPEPVGTVEVALSHAARLLATDPALAAEQASEILKVVPDLPRRSSCWASLGDGSVTRLRPSRRSRALASKQPNWAAAQYELGLALGADRKGDEAVAALRRAVELKPEMGEAWLALADHLTVIGDTAAADEAYARTSSSPLAIRASWKLRRRCARAASRSPKRCCAST